MPEERPENRRLRNHPWIAAFFAALAGLFIYSIWIAPHDKDRATQNAPISVPAEGSR
jgi:hypothetical protein